MVQTIKNEILKMRAFLMMALMMTSLLAVSCSSDDDDNYEVEEETTTTTDDDDNSDDSSSSDGTTATISDGTSSGTPEGDTENTAEDEDDLVANTDFDATITIVYNGSSVTVSNDVDGVTIEQDGADVTVNSTTDDKIIYKVSGTTTDGMLKIYSDKKFQLALSDLSITNNDSPAINIQSKKTIFVVLEGENNLEDGSSYSDIPDEEDAKAAFFSEGQLVFSGSGSLNVAGNYKHGIASDDYVRVIEGTITVSEAVKDGIHTNDYVVVDGGTLNITATSDAIEAEEGYIVINDGTFNIEAGDDGIAASYDVDEETEPDYEITPYVTINGGTFDINVDGEGLESKSVLTINDGTIEIEAKDDGLNAGDYIYINGGKLYVYSSGNDAIDSNGNLTITGGTIVAIGDSVPEGSFDCDQNTFKITGGNMVGIGGAASTPSSSSSQYVAMLGSYGTANKLFHLRSSAGDEALTFLVPQSYSTMVVSNAKLEKETYTIYTGGSVEDGEDFHGLYTSGTYTGGTKSSNSFTISSTVTSSGVTGGHGGGRP